MPTLYTDIPHLLFQNWPDQDYLEPVVTESDAQVLRALAVRIGEIASEPVNEKRRGMWTALNDLAPGKAMVWINEVCWNEMGVDGELALRTRSTFCRRIEAELRQTIYQWEHMQGDMVVNPVIYAPLVIENSGLGISFEEDILKTDEENDIVSHRYRVKVASIEDIEKIKAPVITHREDQTKAQYDAYQRLFEGILPVEKRGVPGFWFAPWDDIVRLTGIQEALTDLLQRPEYIHALVGKVVDCYLKALDQFEAQGLLASNNANVRIGSGAYGYTEALPRPEKAGAPVGTKDLWGAATAQIFAAVSPPMHDEFALAYEKKWLSRFGISYYGCCEPLDRKIEMLRSVPNLRKVSMSPWIDRERAAEAVGRDYVFSYKPSPALLAGTKWKPEEARKDLVTMLEIAKRRGCRLEIIMKDVSTVRHEPRRLWEWARIASEVTESFT